MARGINVPDGLLTIKQNYHESTVTEFFKFEEDREKRFDELAFHKRSPLRFRSHIEPASPWGLVWTEPRGLDLNG